MRLARAAAAALIALVASAVAAVPASAETYPVLGCAASAGSERGLYVFAQNGAAALSHYTGTADLQVNVDNAGTTYASVDVVDGHFAMWIDDVFDEFVVTGADVFLRIGAYTSSCTTTYAPAAVDVSGTTSLLYGDPVTLLVDPDAPRYSYAELAARLDVYTSAGWREVAAVPISTFGGYGLLSYKPPYSQQARVVIERKADGVALGASSAFWLNVRHATAKMTAKPSTILQGVTAKASVAFGDRNTNGRAKLQKYSGGAWVTFLDVPLTSGRATFAWKASAQYSYRVVAVPSTGKSSVTPTFRPAFERVIRIDGPPSIGRNNDTSVMARTRFPVYDQAKLQYWTGSAWKTYKTFTFDHTTRWDGKEVGTIVSLHITATRSWRVVAGPYISNTIKLYTYGAG